VIARCLANRRLGAARIRLDLEASAGVPIERRVGAAELLNSSHSRHFSLSRAVGGERRNPLVSAEGERWESAVLDFGGVGSERERLMLSPHGQRYLPRRLVKQKQR